MSKIFWKKIGIAALVTLYIITGLAAFGLYSLQNAYAGRVYPGVMLAGIDFSGKNWDAAAAEVEKILRSFQETTVQIRVEGGETFNPTLSELGVEFDKERILATMFAIGHGARIQEGVLAALQSLFVSQSVDLIVNFNDSALVRYVDETTAALSKKPKNAALKIVNGMVEIEPSQAGRIADPDYLKREIRIRLSSLQFSSRRLSLAPIILSIAHAAPAITEEKIIGVQSVAQSMIGDQITMTLNDKTYVFTPSEIGTWIVFKEIEGESGKTYQPEFDEAKISASIAAKIARSVDVKMVPKRILITTGQVVDEGRDGRTLNRIDLLSEIKKQLVGQTRTTIALPVVDVPKTEQQVYPDFTLGLYEGRYIEINLTKQMMYAIEGNVLVDSFVISSGKEWGGYATPTGTWYIMNKLAKPYSRPYALWMPYWNGLAKNPDGSGYAGYGIHELPCFNISCTRREGLNHLGTPVSHGCIRLGHNGPAAFIYDWAPIGTPVYIHR